MTPANGRQDRSGWRLVIAGTGGQGVVTAARSLCDCFIAQGRHVVSSQLHGMAQRGGSVQASVIIDGGISPVIASGRADVVVGLEPVETARVLPLMSARTLVYMNTAPVIPFVLGQRSVYHEGGAEYPDVESLTDRIRAVTPHVFVCDATRRAIEVASARTLNIVMLGWVFGSGALPCMAEEFWNAIAESIPPALRAANRRAFLSGLELGKQFPLARAKA